MSGPHAATFTAYGSTPQQIEDNAYNTATAFFGVDKAALELVIGTATQHVVDGFGKPVTWEAEVRAMIK